MFSSPNLYLAIALAPLLGAVLAGLFGTGFLGRQVGRRTSHMITIALVAFSALGCAQRFALRRHRLHLDDARSGQA
jgi:NADH-quinone oxidoreductase subunit L